MVVIGAGLAGLTAAATAARGGASVVVLEAHGAGGRARTDERGGFLMNQGPRALYRGGPAWRTLAELKVGHRGHSPPLRGLRGLRGGGLVPLLRTGVVASLAPRLLAASPAGWAGHSAEDWVASLGASPEVAGAARALIRVATYVADLEALPADLALAQLRTALGRGVSYLDGGWRTLVDGLSAAACGAGAVIEPRQAVSGIHGTAGDWEVSLAGGGTRRAAAVVVAAGGPVATRRLLPVDPGWGALGPEVTAACLDVGVAGHRPPVVFGLDRPLYLSPHAPPGNLAPAGASLVHVLRYGAGDARGDRRELRDLARVAGVDDERVVQERFLARMVVSHLLPTPAQGLAGRPGVAVEGAPGVLVAGDWVGPSGWLADAAVASGRRAGLLAAQAAARTSAVGAHRVA